MELSAMPTRGTGARNPGAESTRMFTVKELAGYLRVHPSTVYRLMRAHQLPGFKVGSDWRFSLEDVEQWRHARMAPSGVPRAKGK
jgi:excisionase family DNA binding protein